MRFCAAAVHAAHTAAVGHAAAHADHAHASADGCLGVGGIMC